MLATLTCENVSKVFMQGTVPVAVLENISVVFKQGESYAITGISGTGKSTLMHILAGLDVPTQGNVFYNNENVQRYTAAQRNFFLNRTVGLMFQVPYLIRELSVLENICMPGIIAGKSSLECQQKGLMLLERLHLADKAHVLPATLSGGQQQRIALLRAIFNDPVFLIADEPTGNVDEKNRAIIIDLLHEYQQTLQVGIIVSTHDAVVARTMNSRYNLSQGCLKPFDQ